jgi:phospholipid/cholesterol/gamma-HCH transport system substrate-binding protein
MRSRTIREGSVGLLILVGVAVFVSLVLWLRGALFGRRDYQFIANFSNVVGLQEGAAVRYRGVQVGEITGIEPATNGVDTTIQISTPDLLIPRNAVIEANQSGLIGETTIDIRPTSPLSQEVLDINPRGERCDSDLVICQGDRVQGELGVSFLKLLRNSTTLTDIYADPQFFNNLNTLTVRASDAAAEVAELSEELTRLSSAVRAEVDSFSTAANSVSAAASETATRLGNTAEQFGTTAVQLNQLITSANELVSANRGNLVNTLNSIDRASDRLSVLINNLIPAAEQINTAVTEFGTTAEQVNLAELLQNVETLSTNAAQASEDLQDLTSALSSPENILVLQQTLDSARVTFQNAQKITSDLDALTGDPTFRENLRELVNGLSQLVSSTQQLQQQVEVAQALEPLDDAIEAATEQSESAAQQQAHELFAPSANRDKADSQQTIRRQPRKLFSPVPEKPSADATSEAEAEVTEEPERAVEQQK